jgi:hypothetical protein
MNLVGKTQGLLASTAGCQNYLQSKLKDDWIMARFAVKHRLDGLPNNPSVPRVLIQPDLLVLLQGRPGHEQHDHGRPTYESSRVSVN